ncbi:MAG TPA: DUF928 domain-containing protein [Usitatibacter sp.]|nr:DUF928 domain-containing protein [Usitatibacter sp.]
MKATLLIASAVISIAGSAWAEDKKPAAPQQETPKAAASEVEYRPPSRGAPKVRVGGSTRGIAQRLSLAVIAPDHVGLSSTAQPDLYWYISRPVESPLEFALYPVDATDPLVEKAIPPVATAGIQRIRLSELGVKLKAGEEYQWLISFASKPNSRAKDAIASGRVRMQPASSPLGSYAAAAQAGYWYDAYASLRNEMARHPNDARLAAVQQTLLEQVGLGEVARSETERLTAGK